MFDLKPLDPDAVPAALARAERYRLLNEPSEAESICLDVLAVDAGQPAGPDHAPARPDRSVRPGRRRAQRGAREVLAGPDLRLRPRLLRRASSPSAAPRRSSPAPARPRAPASTSGSRRRCSTSSAPNRSASTATTTPGCAGTRACASCSGIRSSARPPTSGASSRCSNRRAPRDDRLRLKAHASRPSPGRIVLNRTEPRTRVLTSLEPRPDLDPLHLAAADPADLTLPSGPPCQARLSSAAVVATGVRRQADAARSATARIASPRTSTRGPIASAGASRS